MIFDIFTKTKDRVEMPDVCDETECMFIQNRLEKLMPWISGSYIPIKKLSEDPPPPTKHGCRFLGLVGFLGVNY